MIAPPHSSMPDVVFTLTCIGIIIVLGAFVIVARAIAFVFYTIITGMHLAGEIYVAGWILRKIGLPMPDELKRRK